MTPKTRETLNAALKLTIALEALREEGRLPIWPSVAVFIRTLQQQHQAFDTVS